MVVVVVVVVVAVVVVVVVVPQCLLARVLKRVFYTQTLTRRYACAGGTVLPELGRPRLRACTPFEESA